MSSWYRLDNAGKLYPALIGPRRTTVFRLSADLVAPVHAPRLQKALDRIMPRFPFYAVNLRHGVFWYSLVQSPHQPQVVRDSKYPCMRFPLKNRGMFPFRVRAWRNRIAVEFSHVLADGTGAATFLQSLLAEYLALSGVPRGHLGNIPKPGSLPLAEEEEDAFRRFGDINFPDPPPLEKAFRLPLRLERPGYYRVISGTMPVAKLKQCATDYDCTMTEFLAGVMLDSYREILLEMPKELLKRHIAPLRINIPVNLRQLWPTATLRNFFVSVEPEIDPRLGEWKFDEIIDRTKTHMRYEVDRRYLGRRMARNVRGELNPWARALPLGLKNIVLPIAYASFAEKKYSTGLSNLGLMKLPQHLAPYVKRFDFIPPPAPEEKVKAAVIGWKDSISMSFGRLIRPAIVEQYVFRKLIRMGVPVKVQGN